MNRSLCLNVAMWFSVRTSNGSLIINFKCSFFPDQPVIRIISVVPPSVPLIPSPHPPHPLSFSALFISPLAHTRTSAVIDQIKKINHLPIRYSLYIALVIKEKYISVDTKSALSLLCAPSPGTSESASIFGRARQWSPRIRKAIVNHDQP